MKAVKEKARYNRLERNKKGVKKLDGMYVCTRIVPEILDV